MPRKPSSNVQRLRAKGARNRALNDEMRARIHGKVPSKKKTLSTATTKPSTKKTSSAPGPAAKALAKAKREYAALAKKVNARKSRRNTVTVHKKK